MIIDCCGVVRRSQQFREERGTQPVISSLHLGKEGEERRKGGREEQKIRKKQAKSLG